MKKDLPKMYQNKINKVINNTQKIYSSINDDNIYDDCKYDSISIEKKIDNIFKAPDYVYKADVNIVTDNEIIKRRIVARNKNNIITINNEYIPISIIRDIYK